MFKFKFYISFISAFVSAFAFCAFSVSAMDSFLDNAAFNDSLLDSQYILFDGSYSAVNNTPSVASFIGSYYDGWNSYYSSDGVNWDAGNYNIGGLQYRDDLWAVSDPLSGPERHNVIRWQSISGRTSFNTWNGSDDYGKITTPGYGQYYEAFAFSWINFNTYRSDPEYGDIVFYDVDGVPFAQCFLDVNGNDYHWDHKVNASFLDPGVEHLVLVLNDLEAGTHDVLYFEDYGVGFFLACSVTDIDGIVNGLGSFTLSRGRYNVQWNGTMGLGDFKIYGYNYLGSIAFETQGSEDVNNLSGWLTAMISGGMQCLTDMFSGVEIFGDISLLYVIAAFIALNIIITFLWSRFKGSSLGSTSTNYIPPPKDNDYISDVKK